MNMRFEADTKLLVHVTLSFRDGLIFKYPVLVFEDAPSIYTVVGRKSEEVVKIILEYSGHSYEYPVINYCDDGIGPIRISEKRDYWSQLLREKALEKS